jgi:hypothetical protein
LEKLWGLAIRDVDTVEENVLLALAGDEDSKPHFSFGILGGAYLQLP